MCVLSAYSGQDVRAADCNPFVKKGQSPFLTVSGGRKRPPFSFGGPQTADDRVGRSDAGSFRRAAHAGVRMTSFRREIPADRPVCGKLTYGTTAQLRLRVSAVFLPNCAVLPYFSRIMGRFSAFRSSSLTHSAASAGVRRRCSPVCMFFTEHLPAAISSSPSRTAKSTPSLLA